MKLLGCVVKFERPTEGGAPTVLAVNISVRGIALDGGNRLSSQELVIVSDMIAVLEKHSLKLSESR
jgi:hypothetical protein